MADVKFPVFIKTKDSGHVLLFASLDAMQNWMEKIDVENNEYEAWDELGVPLSLSVQKAKTWLLVQPSGVAKPDQLRHAIAEYARIQNVRVDDAMLDRDDFSGALQQISVSIAERRKSESWWQKLKHRF
jgi:hypothetical protein